MTNPMGRSFLSYRRTRKVEAQLIVTAQHHVGIPTWQDIENLDEEQTDSAIERTLSDADVANAVLWLTPDVRDSAVIRRVEVPCVLRRVEKKDLFFAIPVCAGGLDYDHLDEVLDPSPTLEDLGKWNLRKFGTDPIGPTEAVEVARRVFDRRIAAVHKSLGPNEPITVGLYTSVKPPADLGLALAIDWSECFSDRVATERDWSERLLPSVAAVAEAIRRYAPGRPVLAKGLASLPAAFAFGCAFRAPSGMSLSWEQNMPLSGKQIWGIYNEHQKCPIEVTTRPTDVNGRDLAVLVSVTTDVRPAFVATKAELPPFRAIIEASHPAGTRHKLENGGEALALALRLVEEIDRARKRFQPLDCLHLFMAAPIGFAVLLAQLTNTLGPVRPYQHLPVDIIGVYRSSLVMNP